MNRLFLKKWIVGVFVFNLFFIQSLSITPKSYAATCADNISFSGNENSFSFSLNGDGKILLNPNRRYFTQLIKSSVIFSEAFDTSDPNPSTGKVEAIFNLNKSTKNITLENRTFTASGQIIQAFSTPGSITFILRDRDQNELCSGTINVTVSEGTCIINVLNPETGQPLTGTDIVEFNPGQALQYNGRATNLSQGTELYIDILDARGQGHGMTNCSSNFDNEGNFSGSIPIAGELESGTGTLRVFLENIGDIGCSKSGDIPICSRSIPIGIEGTSKQDPIPGSGTLISTDICQFAGNKFNECSNCVNSKQGIWTALGCIPANPQDFVVSLLRIAIGLAGGIAFLMIIYGGFQIMISSGNPEKLNNGKEIVTSAIAGLLLIIFSVIILKIIGVDILGIPGLTG